MPPSHDYRSNAGAFAAALRHAWTSVFFLVIGGTYVGIGALAHDFGFSVWWLTASTVIVWAGPAQVILISSVATGTTLIETAIAVWLSGIRLFPMVVSLLPLLRNEKRQTAPLLLPAQFTSVSMWVESMRMLPDMPRERRLAYCNGLAVGYMATAVLGGFAGFYLAAGLPPLLAAGLSFLTPLSFLMSSARNCRQLLDILAFAFGVVLGPLLAWYQVGLDLMWSGIVGGLAAYGIHRLREALR
jgi:predicted branched-subunit amino acid permease